MKIVSVDKIHPVLFEMLNDAGHTTIDISDSSDEEVLAALPNYDGLLMRNRVMIDKEFIDQHSKLRFVGRVGSGLEKVDLAYAKEKGLEVFSSPEGNKDSVAEHALGMLLAWLNKLVHADNQIRSSVWDRNPNRGEELQGKTVGIIGFGNTGSSFAQLLSGFGVRVLAYDKYKSDFANDRVDEVSMDVIFSEADVVSIHLPLTEETQFLVDERWLNQFRNPIILINTSRGQIVKTSALVNAMNAGHLRGCCLDVIEYEDDRLYVPEFSTLPKDFHDLLDSPNVILSPHCAGLSPQSYLKLSSVMAEKIIQHFGRA